MANISAQDSSFSSDITLHSTTGLSLYQQCSKLHAPHTDTVLLCMTDGLAVHTQERESNVVAWLLVLCGSLVFFMQLGFAMLCAGSVRRKNISNTLLKNLLDACSAALAFFSIGYAFSYGGANAEDGPTFLGHANFFLMAYKGVPVDLGFWFYQYAFSAASVTIIAGTLAERCLMSGYICYSMFMTGFVYPVVVHAVWSENGFLSAFAAKPLLGIGCIDFAGSGVVHLTGGTTALIATWILGARKGRFESGASTTSGGGGMPKVRAIPGHSIALQVMGGLILWFGWFGFNCGSALLLPNAPDTGAVAALVAVNTSMSAAMGAISSLALNMYLHHRETGELPFDLTMAVNGMLCGLVSITAGGAVVEPWAAAVIGIVAGWIYLGIHHLLIRLYLDDAVDGIPVHMSGGCWGLLSTGLLASPGRLQAAYNTTARVGFFYSLGTQSHGVDFTLFGVQFTAIIFIVAWSTVLMMPFFFGLNYLGWFRVNTMEEIAGLDARYNHGTQEDHDQLRQNIINEFKKHQKDQQRDEKQQQSRRNVSSTDDDGWD